MPAPVEKNQELELRIDSLAYGGNGVARLDGFVVFVRRGLPGDIVRARVTKVKRGYAEAIDGRGARARPEPGRGAVRPLRRLRRLPLPGSRLRGAVESKAAQVRDALVRIGRHRRAAARADRPGRVAVYGYRNKLEYSFARHARGPGARLPPRRPLGRGARARALPADDRARQRDPRRRPRVGARGGARRPTTRRSSRGYLRHLVVREGRNTGQALVQLVTAHGEPFERRALRRARCDASPRCARSTGRSTTRRPR